MTKKKNPPALPVSTERTHCKAYTWPKQAVCSTGADKIIDYYCCLIWCERLKIYDRLRPSEQAQETFLFDQALSHDLANRRPQSAPIRPFAQEAHLEAQVIRSIYTREAGVQMPPPVDPYPS